MKVEYEIIKKFAASRLLFVGSQGKGLDMRIPFAYGEYAAATEAHMLILIPKKDVLHCPDLEDNSDYVRDAIVKPQPNCNFILDLSNIPEYKTMPDYEECAVCDGEGTDYEEGVECKACSGKGHTAKQIGIIREKTEFFKIKEAYFNPDYIKLIHENFPYKWNVTTIERAKAMKMVHENIVILLMPVRAEYVEDEKEANIYELIKEERDDL